MSTSQTAFTLQQLAEHIQADFKGEPNYTVHGITTLKKATPRHISFLSNTRYSHELKTTQAGVVILSKEHLPHCPTHALITENPHLGFAKIARLFLERTPLEYGIHPTAILDKTAHIASNVKIGPYVVVGPRSIIENEVHIEAGCIIGQGVQIGEGSHLFAHVTLHNAVKIGQRVAMQSGAVIGSDGFGYAKEETPTGFRWLKIPQQGGVIIGDDVEIGAHTTIDRGALEDTRIEEGVILDNHIQIAHNVQIGAYTAMAGCSAVGGSTKIGKYCAIGGASGIAGHIEITDHVMITGRSNITHSILKPGVYGGIIKAHTNWKRNSVAFQHLSELFTRVRQIEKACSLFKKS